MDPHDAIDFKAQPPPGYVTQSRDTAYWAERLMFERLAAMTPQEKIAAIGEFHCAAYRIQLGALARLYPHATARELELLAAERRVGRDLVERVLAAEALAPGRVS